MKAHYDKVAGTLKPTAKPISDNLDWRDVANERLARLVEIEHDYYAMRDRLNLLQMEYRKLLNTAERERVASDLERAASRLELVRLEARLDALAHQHAGELASVLGSRSWRLTRPLRNLSEKRSWGRQRFGGLMRAMLGVPLFRYMARFVARLAPGLHQRVRTTLYPNGRKL